MDKVLDFIKRRFQNDSNWTTGNCYYFAVILQSRFGGTIYYDVIDGHFVTEIGGILYDWNGVVNTQGYHRYIKWSVFEDYDSIQKERIIEDCIF